MPDPNVFFSVPLAHLRKCMVTSVIQAWHGETGAPCFTQGLEVLREMGCEVR